MVIKKPWQNPIFLLIILSSFRFSLIYDNGVKAGKEIALNQRGITGIVTTADICAVGCMEGLRLGGVRIPGEISIVGYDDLSICNYTYPKLTSISQNYPAKSTSWRGTSIKMSGKSSDSEKTSHHIS